MNLSNETKEKLILTLLGQNEKEDKQISKNEENDFYEIGKVYVVRTVTMIYLGKLKAKNNNELLLTEAAWIPDTSRWNEFLKGEKPNEMEPYFNDVIISKGGILDSTVMSAKMIIEVR